VRRAVAAGALLVATGLWLVPVATRAHVVGESVAADGVSTVRLHVERLDALGWVTPLPLRRPTVDVRARHLRVVGRPRWRGGHWLADLRSERSRDGAGAPGRRDQPNSADDIDELEVRIGGQEALRQPLRLIHTIDMVHTVRPAAAPLGLAPLTGEVERSRFAERFAAVAAAQARRIDPRWEPSQRDCAGLLRFAYREALRALGRYPEGGAAFVVSADPAAALAPQATAELILSLNTVFVSRSLADARPGDLLFYKNSDAVSEPYHSMVVLGDDVVYHTGDAAGTVRRVTLAELLAHPDLRWQPRIDNPRFAGVYRWRILS
jgi:uncharacterized protein YfaT (DUF1175 family)